MFALYNYSPRSHAAQTRLDDALTHYAVLLSLHLRDASFIECGAQRMDIQPLISEITMTVLKKSFPVCFLLLNGI
jgi:hypothetical protein